MLKSYEKIPVVVRWIIYLPAVILASYVVLLFMSLLHCPFMQNAFGSVIFQLLMAVFTAIVVVYFSYHLAPKHKFAFSVAVYGVVSLMQILSIVKITAKIYYPDMDLIFQDGIDFVLIIIWFAVGMPYLLSLKNVTKSPI